MARYWISAAPMAQIGAEDVVSRMTEDELNANLAECRRAQDDVVRIVLVISVPPYRHFEINIYSRFYVY